MAKREKFPENWWHQCPSLDGTWIVLSLPLQPECRLCGKTVEGQSTLRLYVRRFARWLLKATE